MARAWEFDPKDFTTLQNAMSQLASLAGMAPNFLAGIEAAKQVLASMSVAEDAKDRAEKDLAALKKQIEVSEKAAKDAKDLQGMAESTMETTRKALEVLDGQYISQRAKQEKGLNEYLSSASEQIASELSAAREDAGKQIKSLTAEVKKLEERKAVAESALLAIKASL